MWQLPWGKTPLPSLSILPPFLVNLWIAVEWFCSEWHAQPRTAKLYLLTTNQEHVENLQTASRIGSTLITRHPWLVKLSTLNLLRHVEYLVSKNRSGELDLTIWPDGLHHFLKCHNVSRGPSEFLKRAKISALLSYMVLPKA